MLLVNLTFKKFPANTADALYVRELSKGFSHILSEKFLLVAGNDTSDELREIPHHIIEFKRASTRTLYYFFYIPLLFLKLRHRYRETVVFFSNDHFLLTSLLLWRKIFRLPYTVCADWHMYTDNWKDALIARRADLHIMTSEHLRKQLVKKFAIRKENTHTVYGGFRKEDYAKEVSRPSLRQTLGLPQGKTLVGYVGFFRTLGLEKGIETMIAALREIKDDGLMMVFVGGLTQEIEYYEALARQAGVPERCIFVERVPFERVSAYECAMDMLVIPYPNTPHFRDYGFPMKTYAYMASGIPIVYSNLPIIDEVLRGYGFPFRAGDSRSLAETIQKVRTNMVAVRELAQKARARADILTWDDKAAEICAHLQKKLTRNTTV